MMELIKLALITERGGKGKKGVRVSKRVGVE